MILRRSFLLRCTWFLLLAVCSPAAAEEAAPVNKLHIVYLAQTGQLGPSVDLYFQYKEQLGKHDFEVLQQMALVQLEQGMKSSDPEEQLLSLFGAHLAGVSASIDILEAGIKSPHAETQIAAIQFLGNLQEDRSEELLTRAMASPFLFTRMQAAEQLALRKSRSAVGQIESLMYRLPPEFRFFFPPFFAAIGTPEAISLLRHMMDEPARMTRVEAILSAARFGRDDLIKTIRAKSTLSELAEQEACCWALGALKDSKSIPILKKRAESSAPHVRIAALQALYSLGNEEAKHKLIEEAAQGEFLAMGALGNLVGGEDTLYTLTKSKDIHTRFNATLSLLQRRDPRVIEALKEFLIWDTKDLGFEIHHSPGHSLSFWRVVPSAVSHQKASPFDLLAFSAHVREELIRATIELPETAFLRLAEKILLSGQAELVPMTISLLENIRTKEALDLLRRQSITVGYPLLRTYAQLALLRLGEGSQDPIAQWIATKHTVEMIRFRKILPWDAHSWENHSGPELTPEENSRLLIECYEALAAQHSPRGLDLLLLGLKTGHPKNRPVLAGLLVHAMQ